MCGIYGFQIKPDQELTLYETTVLVHTLAREMESRGRDSFGGVILPDAYILKGLGRVSERGVKLLKEASSSKCFLGHTRAATTGEVSCENSHPFKIGDVLGVHNGIVSNHEELNHKYNRSCVVDSQHIFAHLNENLPMTDIEGYGTFVWARSSDEYSKLYIARTIAGMLTVARIYRHEEDEEGSQIGIVWASESSAIKRVAAILGLVAREVTTPSDKVFVISGGEIFDDKQTFSFRTGWRGKGNNYNNHTSQYSFEDEEDYGPAYGCVWDPTKSDKNNQDEDEGSDLTINMPQLLAYELRGGVATLGKREKRAIRRRLAYFRNKAKDSGNVKPPISLNIHRGVDLKRYFLPKNEQDKDAAPVYICDDCNCPLRFHIWGWCLRDNMPICKIASNKGCGQSKDGRNLPICSDCGHYLVKGIHDVDDKYDVVQCKICNDYCAPEVQIINITRLEHGTGSNSTVEATHALATVLPFTKEAETLESESFESQDLN